ncbi:response regulator [Cystobacter fuscus]
MLRLVMEDHGARVSTAASAQEALRVLVAERPELLVSDIGMPGEDGYALINRVRALPPPRAGPSPRWPSPPTPASRIAPGPSPRASTCTCPSPSSPTSSSPCSPTSWPSHPAAEFPQMSIT